MKDFVTLEVLPLTGVGDFRFGMTRAEARSVMRSDPRLWRRAEWSGVPDDVYDDLLLELSYSEDGRLDFVEVAAGRCRVALGGVTLVPGTVGDVVRDLELHGFVIQRVESGHAIEGTGIELFTPSSAEGAEVKGVAVRPVPFGDLDVEFFGLPDSSSIRDWPVEPRVGIAGVHLGQERSEVRRRMGEGAGFPLTAERSVDHYWNESLYVIFDAAGRVREVVAVAPAKPRIGGIELLGMTYPDACSALAVAGFRMSAQPAEIWLPDIEVSVRWKTIDDSAPAVAIAVARSGAGRAADRRKGGLAG
jgi:hypothetical protein